MHHLKFSAYVTHKIFEVTKNEYLQFFKPLIWPESIRLKVLVLTSLISVIINVIVNLCVPLYAQKTVESLTSEDSQIYQNLTFLLFLKLLQGVGSLSLLGIFQNLIRIKLEQNAYKYVHMAFFSQMHKMSISWQLSQKTGEILGTLERGTRATTSIMEFALFSVIPTIIDILVAVVYLSAKFNGTIGLMVLLQTVCYIWTTLTLAEWRSRHLGQLNKAEDAIKQQAVDSLLNFETVKLFSNEDYEVKKYSEKIDTYNEKEFAALSSLNVLQLAQLFIVNFGVVVGSLGTVWLIVEERTLRVGDYILFTAYMSQLLYPLHYLATEYRTLRSCLENFNDMMEILRQCPKIKKYNTAKTEANNNNLLGQIMSCERIEFRNVHFSHDDGTCVLRGLSLKISGNKSIALVGASGSGKSTILKLLIRLYDPNSGDIFIDGINTKDLSPDLIRKLIGVVPQDTVLFHDSIMNNIKYAKLDATEYEVHRATKSAQIHEKIMSMAEGYDTVVGERGLRLSGGEKQRLALARISLKNPKIVLLDESTSALDVKTESDIMSSFYNLCRNRTSISVTHRLQSLRNVDEIFVIKNGVIVESGSHSQLMNIRKEYYSMWKQQKAANASG